MIKENLPQIPENVEKEYAKHIGKTNDDMANAMQYMIEQYLEETNKKNDK
jgi:hypothetical protein